MSNTHGKQNARPHATLGVCFLWAGAMMFFVSCEGTPQRDQQESFPRLSEVASTHERSSFPEDLPDPAMEQPVAVMTVRQMSFPLHLSLDDAWEVVDEQSLDSDLRSILNANGIRIGFLAVDDLEAFDTTVPQARLIIHSRELLTSNWNAFIRSPRLRVPYEVAVGFDVDADAYVYEAVQGGNLQWLMRGAMTSSSQVWVEMVLHHHRVRPSVVPRSHLETMMDGTLFEMLATSFQANSNELVVIGLHWPTPEEDGDVLDERWIVPETLPSEENTHQKEDVDTIALLANMPLEFTIEVEESDSLKEHEEVSDIDLEEDTPDPARRRTIEDLPTHSGRALFAGVQRTRPVQFLWLIEIKPVVLSVEPKREQPQPDEEHAEDEAIGDS